jgi:hypothetical protein
VQLVVLKVSAKLMFVIPLQVSVAVATPVLAGIGETAHSSVILVGQVMTGGVVSVKLILCVQLDRFPQPSVAVHVRRITPLPVQFVVSNTSTKPMFATPLHASAAVATPVLFVEGWRGHSKVMFAGQVMTGGVVS